MSINGISNGLNGLQQMGSMRGPVSGNAARIHIPATVIEPPAKAVERPFYEYQKEPWLTEPGYEDITNREDYVIRKKIVEEIDLALTQLTYTRFMESLADSHPELASKAFGFTLDENASIKIIDYNESLTDDEKSLLADKINNFDGFNLQLQARARAMMTLVDHDHEIFGGRYKLDIDNFQYVIDFNRLLNVSVKKMHSEWVAQVERKAEQRNPSYISLSV